MEPLTTCEIHFGIGQIQTTSSSILITSSNGDTIVFNDKGEQERVIKTGQRAMSHACRDDTLAIANVNSMDNDKYVISVFSIRTGYVAIFISWLCFVTPPF